MAENPQVSRFINGMNTPSLEGLENIIFKRNMKITSSPVLSISNNGTTEFKFVIDSHLLLNGLYMVNLKLGSNETGFIVAISATATSEIDDQISKNNINILNVNNSSFFRISDISLFKNTAGQFGAVATIETKVVSGLDLTVNVTSINELNQINSWDDASSFTEPVSQTKTGMKNSIEVYDDINGVNINLNQITFPSVVFCNPASANSRPPGHNTGVCITGMGTDDKTNLHQLYFSSLGNIFSRTMTDGAQTTWEEFVTSNYYPKLVASGFNPITITETQFGFIQVNGIDLRKDRYSIVISQEKTIDGFTETFEVNSRLDNGFYVNGTPFQGNVHWAIYEGYPDDLSRSYQVVLGVLVNGNAMAQSTVNEGSTVRAFLNTSNVPDGSKIYYTISGVEQSHIGVPTTGLWTVWNNTAYIDIPVIENNTSEPDRTMRVSVSGSNIGANITVVDNPPTYTLTSNADEVNSGEDITFHLHTTNIVAGTQIPFQLSGVPIADLTPSATTGNFIIDSNGDGYYTVRANVDPIILPPEKINLDLEYDVVNPYYWEAADLYITQPQLEVGSFIQSKGYNLDNIESAIIRITPGHSVVGGWKPPVTYDQNVNQVTLYDFVGYGIFIGADMANIPLTIIVYNNAQVFGAGGSRHTHLNGSDAIYNGSGRTVNVVNNGWISGGGGSGEGRVNQNFAYAGGGAPLGKGWNGGGDGRLYYGGPQRNLIGNNGGDICRKGDGSGGGQPGNVWSGDPVVITGSGVLGCNGATTPSIASQLYSRGAGVTYEGTQGGIRPYDPEYDPPGPTMTRTLSAEGTFWVGGPDDVINLLATDTTNASGKWTTDTLFGSSGSYSISKQPNGSLAIYVNKFITITSTLTPYTDSEGNTYNRWVDEPAYVTLSYEGTAIISNVQLGIFYQDPL